MTRTLIVAAMVITLLTLSTLPALALWTGGTYTSCGGEPVHALVTYAGGGAGDSRLKAIDVDNHSCDTYWQVDIVETSFLVEPGAVMYLGRVELMDLELYNAPFTGWGGSQPLSLDLACTHASGQVDYLYTVAGVLVADPCMN